MAIEIKEENDGRILVLQVSGKLEKEDYTRFVPEVDRLIQEHGKISILFEMRDFHGWEAAALWEDTKFAIKHLRGIERLAFIGQTKWQKGMATFCRPFTSAEIRYFQRGQEAEALSWLKQEVAATI